jgi:CDP-diacylglycerol--serine O-phosphatidyltransferase
MFCGALSMLLAPTNPYDAGRLLVLAGVCDIADGGVARVTNTQSEFGAELDSLSDLLAFGLAPAWLLYHWALAPDGGPSLWFLLAFVYTAAIAIRLARFNARAPDADPGKFRGMPSPSSALLLTAPVLAWHEQGFEFLRTPEVAGALLLSAALLAVSWMQFPSFKKPSKKPSQVVFGLLFFSGLAGLVFGGPGGTLLLAAVLWYLGCVLVATAFPRKRAAK